MLIVTDQCNSQSQRNHAAQTDDHKISFRSEAAAHQYDQEDVFTQNVVNFVHIEQTRTFIKIKDEICDQ